MKWYKKISIIFVKNTTRFFIYYYLPLRGVFVKDLHEFINYIKRNHPEEIREFDEEIEADYEPTAMTFEFEKESNPILLFKKVKGSKFPIVTNVFGTRKRVAHAIRTTLDELYPTLEKRLQNFVKPRMVASGPIKENIMKGKEVDLYKLPIFKHFEQDVGKYVTAGIFVAKDPDTGIRNLSLHRMQLDGRDKFRTSFHSRGHLWRICQKGEKLCKPIEAAIVIGAHPCILLAAATTVGMGVDEYEIAGALMQEPVELVKCETIDVEVPAHAEIVLEGEIPPNLGEADGPFGEYTGYASHRSTKNIFDVKAITFRNNAIYQDITPGNSSEHLILSNVIREAHVTWRLKEIISNLKDISWPKSGTLFSAYLSLSEPIASGEANLAAMLLIGLDHYVKVAVVVNDDIDVHNEQEVNWAIATRVQPDRDVNLVKNVFCNKLDPSSYEDGTTGKLIIDATKKKGIFDTLTVPKNFKEKAARMAKEKK